MNYKKMSFSCRYYTILALFLGMGLSMACQDIENTFKILSMYGMNGNEKTCRWVARFLTEKKCQHEEVMEACPYTCGLCEKETTPCADRLGKFYIPVQGQLHTCKWVAESKNIEDTCNQFDVQVHCPYTCGTCDRGATVTDFNVKYDVCEDIEGEFFIKSIPQLRGKTSKTCDWVGSIDTYQKCQYEEVNIACPETCGLCSQKRNLIYASECEDLSGSFWIQRLGRDKTCRWAADKGTKNRCSKYPEVYENCPMTCGSCIAPCEDNREPWLYAGRNRKCRFVKRKLSRCSINICRRNCPQTCNMCPNSPSQAPSLSNVPSIIPSVHPSSLPSNVPSSLPSDVPSQEPSPTPTDEPTRPPSPMPSPFPTLEPTATPSVLPSSEPSSLPSETPSTIPSLVPSSSPSDLPSALPSKSPSHAPSLSNVPSLSPSDHPSSMPSNVPSPLPSSLPSNFPSKTPSDAPSRLPSNSPSDMPSKVASAQPSSLPSFSPTLCEDEPDWRSGGSHKFFSGISCMSIGDNASWCAVLAGNAFEYDGKNIDQACCTCSGSVFHTAAPSPKPSVEPSSVPSLVPSISNAPNNIASEAPSICTDLNGWLFFDNPEMGCAELEADPYNLCPVVFGLDSTPATDACCVCKQCLSNTGWYFNSALQMGCNIVETNPSTFCTDTLLDDTTETISSNDACCVCQS